MSSERVACGRFFDACARHCELEPMPQPQLATIMHAAGCARMQKASRAPSPRHFEDVQQRPLPAYHGMGSATKLSSAAESAVPAHRGTVSTMCELDDHMRRDESSDSDSEWPDSGREEGDVDDMFESIDTVKLGMR